MIFVKFFHILFVWLWTGTLIGLTRFLGYHAKQPPVTKRALLRIYRRIYFFIDLPCMCLGLTFGIILFIMKGASFKGGWFHMKLTFVAVLIACDLLTLRSLYSLALRPLQGKGIRYKILHGLSALSLVAILFSIYVIKKKFFS